MSFSRYATLFKEKAIKAGYSEDNIQKCLAYAEPLFEKNLPVIYNTTNLSALLGYNKTYLKKAALYTDFYYRSFNIRKKNGRFRNIKEPLPSLKEIQLWILNYILYEIPVSKYAKAYIVGRSLKDNVKFHVEKEKVLSLDVEDFFPSIKRKAVESIFLNAGYSSNISNLLSKLCCLNETLPQGAPTSPYISNIYMNGVDESIADFCTKRKIKFTRYADDLMFSGSFNEDEVVNFVVEQLNTVGLKINVNKTKLMKRNVPQMVTGVVVNKKMQLLKNERKKIRLEMHYIKKFGLSSHLQFIKNTRIHYLKHIRGKINYGLYLNPRDKELLEYLEYLTKNYPDQ
jgi:RNA-directed DNA polymerase